MISFTDVARLAGGELIGPADGSVRAVAPLHSAGPDQLSFVAAAQYLPYLRDSRAGLLLIPAALRDELPSGRSAVVVADAHRALADLLPHLYPERRPSAGVHPRAVVDPRARIARSASISAFAVVEEDAEIGEEAQIGAHAFVGAGAHVGEQTVVHPHAFVAPGARLGARCIIHSGARIGTEGFGFVWTGGQHLKVPQVGGCVLGDDVEVGANTTIDRGSVGDTVVGRGTKIDNLVHVGHNVQIGEHVIVIAQVGISGSTSIGDGAVLAGQAGVGGHLRIGAGARVGAQAGVTADVPPGVTVSGYPARPHREALRAQANMFRLPRFAERLRALEERVFSSSS